MHSETLYVLVFAYLPNLDIVLSLGNFYAQVYLFLINTGILINSQMVKLGSCG